MRVRSEGDAEVVQDGRRKRWAWGFVEETDGLRSGQVDEFMRVLGVIA